MYRVLCKALFIAIHVNIARDVLCDHSDPVETTNVFESTDNPATTVFTEAYAEAEEIIMDPSDPAKTKRETLVPFFKHKIRSYAGYLSIPDRFDGSKLFAWFFPNRNITAPIIIWLQGQPGMSSLYGLFEEHGPFQIDEVTREVTMREYALTNSYHVLYLDPETNCGYSSSPAKGLFYNDMDHIPGQIYDTLRDFYRIFFEYKTNDVYLAGESASHRIIPQIVHYVIYDKDNKYLNLKGILIGGGVFHRNHALHYLKELFRLGIIDPQKLYQLTTKEHEINAFLRASRIEEAFDLIGTIIVDLKKTGYLSVYDVRDPMSTLHSLVPNVVRSPEIRNALHVGNRQFKVKRKALVRGILLPVASMYPEILARIRVLLYNGQFDFFASYTETNLFINGLHWYDAGVFYNTSRKVWVEDGQLVGYWKTVGNLTHALVRNAGHWIGQTQPRALYNLVNNFIRNELN